MSKSAWILSLLFKNHSKITQYLELCNIDVASEHTALRVSVMQWRLEVILSTVHHNECSYGFCGIAIN